MIKSACFQSSIGPLSILAIKEGVVKISIENESWEEMEKWYQSRLDMGIIEAIDELFDTWEPREKFELINTNVDIKKVQTHKLVY